MKTFHSAFTRLAVTARKNTPPANHSFPIQNGHRDLARLSNQISFAPTGHSSLPRCSGADPAQPKKAPDRCPLPTSTQVAPTARDAIPSRTPRQQPPRLTRRTRGRQNYRSGDYPPDLPQQKQELLQHRLGIQRVNQNPEKSASTLSAARTCKPPLWFALERRRTLNARRLRRQPLVAASCPDPRWTSARAV